MRRLFSKFRDIESAFAAMGLHGRIMLPDINAHYYYWYKRITGAEEILAQDEPEQDYYYCFYLLESARCY